MQLKDEEWYWLNASAIDPEKPLIIGQYHKANYGKWFIDDKLYSEGPGIIPIKHIPKPEQTYVGHVNLSTRPRST